MSTWELYMTSYGWMLPFIIFYLVFWGLGKMSGWKELAEIYPLSSTDSDTEIKTFGFVSGKVGGVRYNNALKIGINNRGIFFDVFFAMKLGHPRFFIPWTEIQALIEKKSFMTSFVEVKLKQKPDQKIILPKKIFGDGAFFRPYHLKVQDDYNVQ